MYIISMRHAQRFKLTFFLTLLELGNCIETFATIQSVQLNESNNWHRKIFALPSHVILQTIDRLDTA